MFPDDPDQQARIQQILARAFTFRVRMTIQKSIGVPPASVKKAMIFCGFWE